MKSRPSVVCLSIITLVHPIQPAEIFGNFLRRLVPWPSADIHGKLYGNRPRGPPPLWELNARGVAKYRLVPKSVTLNDQNDLERRNGPYFCVIFPNSVASSAHCVKVVEDVVKKSSRSLSHLLMSFLFTVRNVDFGDLFCLLCALCRSIVLYLM